MNRESLLSDKNRSTVPEISIISNSTNDTRTSEYYGPVLTGIFGTWLVLIIVLAVVGNIFVMLVILLDKQMRHAHNGTNLFLFALAVSDVMTGIFIAPISLHTLIINNWDLGDLTCQANLFLNSLFLFTSVHCLMYISIHKYLSVRRLSECNQLPVSKCACYTMISAAWIWGFLFSILASSVLSHAEYKIKTTQCGPQYPLHDAQSIIISIVNFSLNFLIPFGIMLFMYLRIYFILRTSSAFRRTSCFHTNKSKDGDTAAINTLVIVLTCFFICWLPYMFYTLYVFFTKDRRTLPAFLNPLAYCFGFSNSVCNPIIYAFRFSDFRKGYINILRKLTCREKPGIGTPEMHNHENHEHHDLAATPKDEHDKLVGSQSSQLTCDVCPTSHEYLMDSIVTSNT